MHAVFGLIAVVLASGSVDHAVTPYEIDKDYWFLDSHTIKTNDGRTFYIKELKKYNITARVGGIEYYQENHVPFSPVDLCIASGKLVDPAYNESVNFSMGYRECRPKYKPGSGVGWRYSDEHTSNNHIIPSNKNVFDKLMKIKEGDVIEIRGAFVSVSGSNEDVDPYISSWNPDAPYRLCRKELLLGGGNARLFWWNI